MLNVLNGKPTQDMKIEDLNYVSQDSTVQEKIKINQRWPTDFDQKHCLNRAWQMR